MTMLVGHFMSVDLLILFSIFLIKKIEYFLHGHPYKLTSVHWDRLMCNLGLGIFVNYTVAEFNYQWIIQITNLP